MNEKYLVTYAWCDRRYECVFDNHQIVFDSKDDALKLISCMESDEDVFNINLWKMVNLNIEEELNGMS